MHTRSVRGDSLTKRVIIMGAAGRDFHNFNTYFRNNDDYKVVAFTAATQIPGIGGRSYPPELAGPRYPEGIPIYNESRLSELIKKHDIDLVVFAYSDLPYDYVMHKSAAVNAAGADFMLMGGKTTMLKSSKPMISVCAVRTGCGKSQTSRKILRLLKDKGYKVVAVRHPMPYDPELKHQKCERLASYDDLDRYRCTIEEREEYEAYIDMGAVIYAGVDYGEILKEAEKEADIIIWDGGNNDFPFYESDYSITVLDPHRRGDETSYYPGEMNLLMADALIINKVDTADPKAVEQLKRDIAKANPEAKIITAESPVSVTDPEAIKGKRVLVVEDGPTVTHGDMSFGAGLVAAEKFGAGEIIDPRPFAVGSIKDTFEKFTHLEKVLPAMGYGKEQISELEETINRSNCDVVVAGTPIDLTRIIHPNKQVIRVKYVLKEVGMPDLNSILDDFLGSIDL